jgi:hypothetical protein
MIKRCIFLVDRETHKKFTLAHDIVSYTAQCGPNATRKVTKRQAAQSERRKLCT